MEIMGVINAQITLIAKIVRSNVLYIIKEI